MKKKQLKQWKAEYKKNYVKGWDELLIKLKQYGGEMISPQPESEDVVQWNITEGRIFDATNIKFQPGKIGGCHENSARIWVASDELQLVRGYALDGEIWHQHSWLWNSNTGELIETTMQYDKYFGTILDGVQALLFICGFMLEIDDSFKEMSEPQINDACRDAKKYLRERNFPILAIDQEDARQMIRFDSIKSMLTIGIAGPPPKQTNRFVNQDHVLAELSSKFKVELHCKDGNSLFIEHGNLVKE